MTEFETKIIELLTEIKKAVDDVRDQKQPKDIVEELIEQYGTPENMGKILKKEHDAIIANIKNSTHSQ